MEKVIIYNSRGQERLVPKKVAELIKAKTVQSKAVKMPKPIELTPPLTDSSYLRSTPPTPEPAPAPAPVKEQVLPENELFAADEVADMVAPVKEQAPIKPQAPTRKTTKK